MIVFSPVMSKPARCPICQKPVLPRSQNPLFPFCSARCRAIDLGKWLGEEYRVADGSADEQEDEAPPTEETQEPEDSA